MMNLFEMNETEANDMTQLIDMSNNATKKLKPNSNTELYRYKVEVELHWNTGRYKMKEYSYPTFDAAQKRFLHAQNFGEKNRQNLMCFRTEIIEDGIDIEYFTIGYDDQNGLNLTKNRGQKITVYQL